MSEELQSLVQIIELYGKGLGGLGRALRFSAKGAAKGVEIAQVKRLQHRMKLHYASEGTHNTMKLCDLEKDDRWQICDSQHSYRGRKRTDTVL